ncbi:MAG: TIGR01777 family protein [Candidatus Hydrogenedentota bacterium]|nr:MAG: TIGR01777 family protein [Candidatus Hydrogenedentota bacterium]
MKKILITGKHGALAPNLAKKLRQNYQIRFLSRNPDSENTFYWHTQKEELDLRALEGVSGIVHLAGASVADKRWTASRKKELTSSRVDSAKLLLNSLKQKNHKLDSFVSASATGYYGARTTDHIFTEDDPPSDDFLAKLCHEWEQAALAFQAEDVASRVTIFRLGVVVDRHSGILQKLYLPAKFSLLSPLGSGEQYMPWVHIEDAARAFAWALEKNTEGIYNLTAPQHITNKEFTNTLLETFGRKSWLPAVPSFVLKTAFGEMSQMLLEGSRVSCEKLCKAGFTFQYPLLRDALSHA